MIDKDTSIYSGGKWQIVTEGRSYYANLIASTGEILLSSPSYTALSGVKSGIETIRQNIEKNNFAISVDASGKYFFKIYSSATRLLCVSDGFSSLELCKNAIKNAKKIAKTTIFIQ